MGEDPGNPAAVGGREHGKLDSHPVGTGAGALNGSLYLAPAHLQGNHLTPAGVIPPPAQTLPNPIPSSAASQR